MCYNFKDSSWCLQMSKYILAHPAAQFAGSCLLPDHALRRFQSTALPVTTCDFSSLQVVCFMVTAFLHLFFMAAFSWMLVEGLLLWSKVVAVNMSEDRRMKFYYLTGWGIYSFLCIGNSKKQCVNFFFSKSFARRDSPDSDAESDKCLV